MSDGGKRGNSRLALIATLATVQTRAKVERAPAAAEKARRRRQRPSSRPAIVVKEVEKTYRIPRHRPSTLKERVLHPLRVIPSRELKAAQDISFEVDEGEFFAIVGRNGSGKSTLLKMIAGIYTPDSGTVEVEGRVSPFIELGVGFNMELTARDNVIVNGTMLGLRRAEIARRYPAILEFAGLEEFADLKLKNYSSGMLARLAFSTAVQVDADVLLLDEVLAVGDAGFQEKCFNEFRKMKKEGKTIVFVTHALESIKRFCDRAMMLEDGKLVQIGDPEEISQLYRESAAGEVAEVSPFQGDTGRFGDGSARVLRAWVEGEGGHEVEVVQQGGRIALCAEFEFREAAESPVFGFQVKGEAGFDVFAMNTLWAGHETEDFRRGDRAVLRIELVNHLGVGAYALTPGVANRDGTRIADLRLNFESFRVDGQRWTGAAADLPYAIDVERRGARR